MEKKASRIDEERLLKIVTAAHAYYEQNATQQQIASELGVSRSQVSRYLDKARELEIVTVQINQPDSHIPALEQEILQLFPHLRDVIVVPFASANVASGDSLLGRACAKYLMDVICDGTYLGIGAGRGVQSVVSWLRPTSQSVKVVQTMGSTGYFAQGVDYSLLANEAASNLGAPLYTLNAPTVLWRGAGTVEGLLDSNRALAEVLGISRNCDIYLLGVGAIENDDLFIKSGLLDEAEMAQVRDAGAVGNICASFFTENGDYCGTGFESRIVGVRRDDIEKAKYSVLIAAGAAKVKAITGALRGGFMNVLATDMKTASLIIEQERPFRRP